MLEVTISKEFPGFILKVSFTQNCGTMLLSGPSGSGKTTLLRCLAGLEIPDSGYICFKGKDLFRADKLNIPAFLRKASLMTQDDTLFPHMTVRNNILYTVHDKKNIPSLYNDLLIKLNLSELEEASPATLSGGEKRRVQLARTLMPKPNMLLLDEPFTGLEAELCKQVSDLLQEYCRYYQPTLIIASHIRQELIYWAEQQLNLEPNQALPLKILP